MSSNNSAGGTGFTGLLFLIFLVLKFTKVIDWSWWWVTIPLWGGLALAVVLFLVGAIFYHISKHGSKRR